MGPLARFIRTCNEEVKLWKLFPLLLLQGITAVEVNERVEEALVRNRTGKASPRARVTADGH